jgi:hypothetical protein
MPPTISGSPALRLAREGVVVVLNRDKPDAVLVHLDDEKLLGMPGVRSALATAPFRDGNLPLGRATLSARTSLLSKSSSVSVTPWKAAPVLDLHGSPVFARRLKTTPCIDRCSIVSVRT